LVQAGGFGLHGPRAQGCCCALHAHAGRLEQGIARARALERDLAGYDYIVTNAAGCGSHLKDHGVASVVDVSELLVEPRAERKPLPLRVAFQDSCHLRHAQGVASAPRAMLDAIPGLERLEPAEQDICCGSAGIYNIVKAGTAAELGDRKAGHVLAVQPDAYASGNPGCLVQVTAALRRAGRPLPAFHPVELIDDGSDVKIFVGIDATDDAMVRHRLTNFHAGSPGYTGYWRFHRDRMPGQDSNATERQALLGSRALARWNLVARCSRAVDRSEERHGSWSIGVRVRPPRHPTAPATLNGRSL